MLFYIIIIITTTYLSYIAFYRRSQRRSVALCPIYRQGNWGTNKCDLPKSPSRLSGRVMTRTQVSQIPDQCFSTRPYNLVSAFVLCKLYNHGIQGRFFDAFMWEIYLVLRERREVHRTGINKHKMLIQSPRAGLAEATQNPSHLGSITRAVKDKLFLNKRFSFNTRNVWG